MDRLRPIECKLSSGEDRREIARAVQDRKRRYGCRKVDGCATALGVRAEQRFAWKAVTSASYSLCGSCRRVTAYYVAQTMKEKKRTDSRMNFIGGVE